MRVISVWVATEVIVFRLLDNPHLKLPPTIHVAGTNGKGSTIAFLLSSLKYAGKKVHVYTSPHLIEVTERFILANKKITNRPKMDKQQHPLKIKLVQSILRPILVEYFFISKFNSFKIKSLLGLPIASIV